MGIYTSREYKVTPKTTFEKDGVTFDEKLTYNCFNNIIDAESTMEIVLGGESLIQITLAEFITKFDLK